ncbi:MAG: SusD/RagB family nutrient-binding outer membrane lipoprotein, partial [Pedobacter sp.]
MKEKMKKITTLFLGSVMLFAACKPSDFQDINVNPTAVSSVPTKALLTNVFNGANGSFPSTVFGVNTPVFYAQHLSEGPYPGASLYNTRNFDWAGFYVGSLYNLKTIIDLNTTGSPLADGGINGSKDNQIAVARILKAYYFGYLTDRYGDIPYTDALKGDANFSPKYDLQKDIYYDLFKELKEAGAQIKV